MSKARSAHVGITSACAEQTRHGRKSNAPNKDHLRVCGADTPVVSILAAGVGSPPRVRSRLLGSVIEHLVIGITSACAEQTPELKLFVCTVRDHLRVCGADAHNIPSEARGEGSPPRVRSRLRCHRSAYCSTGITSACAEQTCIRWPTSASQWDHLRVCGADWRSVRSRPRRRGSPPRVRSRPGHPLDTEAYPGITSACAEQTSTQEYADQTV